MFLHDVLRSHLNDELEQRGAPMRVEDLCPQYDGDNFIGAHLTNSRWQGTLRLPWITAEVQGSYEGRLKWAREAASSVRAQYIDLDAEMETILRQKAQDQVVRQLTLYPKLLKALKALAGGGRDEYRTYSEPDGNWPVMLRTDAATLRLARDVLKEAGL